MTYWLLQNKTQKNTMYMQRTIKKKWSNNTLPTVSPADNSVINWRNLPISNPKPDLNNINAHTKFGENLLTLTQVTIWKWKYRWTNGWMAGPNRTGTWMDRQTHGWPIWYHNTTTYTIVVGFKKHTHTKPWCKLYQMSSLWSWPLLCSSIKMMSSHLYPSGRNTNHITTSSEDFQKYK